MVAPSNIKEDEDLLKKELVNTHKRKRLVPKYVLLSPLLWLMLLFLFLVLFLFLLFLLLLLLLLLLSLLLWV